MLTKKIIPCLDIKDGKTVKGVNFVNLKDAGDPVELAKRYVEEGADELVFLDISATLEGRKTIVDLVQRVAKEVSIPFTVGGGINSVEDAQKVLQAGADKISINSAAIQRPELIAEIAEKFGKERLIIAIDTKNYDGKDYVVIKGGSVKTDWLVVDWAKKAEDLGAGEILLTSMNHDGTKNGFALEITDLLSRELQIPVIASGGAGSIEHFIELFTKTNASAGLAASIFHFQEVSIPLLKQQLRTLKIPVK